MSYHTPDVRGKLFGFKLNRETYQFPTTEGYEKREHVIVTISIEDDETFHPRARFDSHWLDDLINTAMAARDKLKEI